MKKPKKLIFPNPKKSLFLPFLPILIILSALLIVFLLRIQNKNNFQPLALGIATNISPSPTTFLIDYVVITETPIPTPTKTPTPLPTKTPTPLPYTSADYEQWFTTYSNHQSINREILKKIAICESNLNPKANNGIYGGLYQFTANSWISIRRAMNLDPNPDLRFDPEEAIKTAAFKIAVSGTKAWPICGK